MPRVLLECSLPRNTLLGYFLSEPAAVPPEAQATGRVRGPRVDAPVDSANWAQPLGHPSPASGQVSEEASRSLLPNSGAAGHM